MNQITIHRSKALSPSDIADPEVIGKLADCRRNVPDDFYARRMTGDEAEMAHCRAVISGQVAIVEKLPPPERTAEIRGQLQAALAIRTPAVVKREVDMLVEARPNLKEKSDDLKVYKQAMAFDLVNLGFADAIVAEACTEARRTMKWLPTISEIIDIAERIRGKWRYAVYQLGQIDASRQAAIAFVDRNTKELERAKSGKPFPELPRLRTGIMRDEDLPFE